MDEIIKLSAEIARDLAVAVINSNERVEVDYVFITAFSKVYETINEYKILHDSTNHR